MLRKVNWWAASCHSGRLLRGFEHGAALIWYLHTWSKDLHRRITHTVSTNRLHSLVVVVRETVARILDREKADACRELSIDVHLNNIRPPQSCNHLSELNPCAVTPSYLCSRAHECMRVALYNCEGRRKTRYPLLSTSSAVGPIGRSRPLR